MKTSSEDAGAPFFGYIFAVIFMEISKWGISGLGELITITPFFINFLGTIMFFGSGYVFYRTEKCFSEKPGDEKSCATISFELIAWFIVGCIFMGIFMYVFELGISSLGKLVPIAPFFMSFFNTVEFFGSICVVYITQKYFSEWPKIKI